MTFKHCATLIPWAFSRLIDDVVKMAAEELIFKYDVWSCIFRKARVLSSFIMHKRYNVSIYHEMLKKLLFAMTQFKKSNLLMSKLFLTKYFVGSVGNLENIGM